MHLLIAKINSRQQKDLWSSFNVPFGTWDEMQGNILLETRTKFIFAFRQKWTFEKIATLMKSLSLELAEALISGKASLFSYLLSTLPTLFKKSRIRLFFVYFIRPYLSLFEQSAVSK